MLFTFVIFLGISTFHACKKSDVSPPEPIPESGFFVVCEGNYNWGNASVSSYDENSDVLTQDYFSLVNGYSLGDVAQSMTENDDFYFIAVNNSGKVEVVDKESFNSTITISDLNSPRFVQPISDSLIYISDLFADEISIVNFYSGDLVGTVPVFSWSEQMDMYEDSVYVALYDSKSIGVINAKNHQLITEIQLEMSPSEIRIDKDGMIWVLASEWGSGSTVYKINSTTRSIDGEWQFDESNSIIQLSLSVSGNSVYLLSNTGDVFKFSTLTSTIIDPLFTVDHDGMYGLDVDKDGNIYICDANDYVQNGSVNKYNESGVLLYSVPSGVSPNCIVFR